MDVCCGCGVVCKKTIIVGTLGWFLPAVMCPGLFTGHLMVHATEKCKWDNKID
jgi:hypothetical protein